MSLVIRQAEGPDEKALAELIEEIEKYYGSSDVQSFEERLAGVRSALFEEPPLASVLLAVDEDEGIVGMAAYSFLWPAAGATHSLFLKELFVRQGVRRQGVGSRLMEELRTVAASRPGCGRIEWMTDRNNPTALSFYQARDFPELDGKIIYRLEGDELDNASKR
jgi:GNAT superfamily N-acetyltransferase